MSLKRAVFPKSNKIGLLFILTILVALLSGCVGTFRTADVLKEGEGTITISAPVDITNTTGKLLSPFASSLMLSVGLRNQADLGMRIFIPGIEFLYTRSLSENENSNPKIALQMGLGLFIPGTIGEIGLLFSEKLSPFTLYSSLKSKFIYYNEPKSSGIAGFYSLGIQTSPFKSNRLINWYIEIYNDYGVDNIDLSTSDFVNYSKHMYVGMGFRIGKER